MLRISHISVSFVTGLFFGLATVFVLCSISTLLAYSLGRSISIPFVYRAWFTEENGMPALNFMPHGSGILVASTLIAVAYAAWAELGRQER
ncbi:hypothetical protein [Actinomyces trachealis]|uniref:hypothetical protein n=1 Tax=Actinomyces trachealis TaxID=2763540 RepID=UPI00189294C2|nr:hypothetical protein [Actinomyces trachealis]